MDQVTIRYLYTVNGCGGRLYKTSEECLCSNLLLEVKIKCIKQPGNKRIKGVKNVKFHLFHLPATAGPLVAPKEEVR